MNKLLIRRKKKRRNKVTFTTKQQTVHICATAVTTNGVKKHQNFYPACYSRGVAKKN